jgi:hypothetical protein
MTTQSGHPSHRSKSMPRSSSKICNSRRASASSALPPFDGMHRLAFTSIMVSSRAGQPWRYRPYTLPSWDECREYSSASSRLRYAPWTPFSHRFFSSTCIQQAGASSAHSSQKMSLTPGASSTVRTLTGSNPSPHPSNTSQTNTAPNRSLFTPQPPRSSRSAPGPLGSAAYPWRRSRRSATISGRPRARRAERRRGRAASSSGSRWGGS